MEDVGRTLVPWIFPDLPFEVEKVRKVLLKKDLKEDGAD